jgi:hypothetical protein
MSALPRIGFAFFDLLTAALVLVGVFVGLPSRWWPVDAGALVVACTLVVAAVGLLAQKPWAWRAVRIASGIVLALGLALVTFLALTVAHLSGVHGPVGKGGSLAFAFVLALVLPYLLVLPVLQLLWTARPLPK